jgi:hypothetical protein
MGRIGNVGDAVHGGEPSRDPTLVAVSWRDGRFVAGGVDGWGRTSALTRSGSEPP